MVQEKERGVIKFWSDKGFGFIERGERQDDLFVHATALLNANELAKGDKIEYEEGTDERSGRPRAIKVKLVEE